MSLPPLGQLTAKLSAFAKRVRQSTEGADLAARIAALGLNFTPPSVPGQSIWWDQAPALHNLFELPRDALSGPVQEDKAHAHQALKRLVHRNQWETDTLDLRSINGLIGHDEHPFVSLEHYSAARCRQIRIISFNDLQKALGQLFTDNAPMQLNQASWRGDRLFFAHMAGRDLLASITAYTRLRQLRIEKAAVIAEYHLHTPSLNRLSAQFHVLAMPAALWSDEHFLALFVSFSLPYSRLKLPGTTPEHDWLILPKNHPTADLLGQSLSAAGATQLSDYVKALSL